MSSKQITYQQAGGLTPEPLERMPEWTLRDGISKTTLRVVLFQGRFRSHLQLHLPSHFTKSD
jgi:hypothetical protein